MRRDPDIREQFFRAAILQNTAVVEVHRIRLAMSHTKSGGIRSTNIFPCDALIDCRQEGLGLSLRIANSIRLITNQSQNPSRPRTTLVMLLRNYVVDVPVDVWIDLQIIKTLQNCVSLRRIQTNRKAQRNCILTQKRGIAHIRSNVPPRQGNFLGAPFS